MQNLRVLLLCSAFPLALSACKVEITVPRNGTVETLSGNYSCGAREKCVIDVEDTTFDETFIARPNPGYAFSRWTEKPQALCGNSNSPCRLLTSPLAGTENVSLLESDEALYLEPVFVEYENYDFESGKLDLNCSGNCPRITTRYTRSGRYAIASTISDSSRNVRRTEAVIPGTAKFMEYERDYWVGFSIYLPEGWEVPEDMEILAQFHRSKRGGGQPPVAIYSGSGNWKITSNSPAGRKEWILHSVLEDVGRWTDFVIHYKPSHRDSGVLAVWKDGALVARRDGPNTPRDPEGGPYFKLGVYKGKYRAPEKTVYHDELRIASGPDANYAVVAPR